jgi:hypothetical protein
LHLLLDALQRIARSATDGPAVKVILVDALNDRVAEFYTEHGFRPLPVGGGAMYLRVDAVPL